MIYPNINPVALDLGFVQIYWYGVMYLLAFLSAYFLANHRAKQLDDWNKQQIEDMIFYGAIGVVAGGRLGYMLFYNLDIFLANPLTVFAVQNGGMSFHGGLLGVILAMILFNRKYNKAFFTTVDFIAPLVPLGLGFGRLGNFINSELWGKVTNSPFGMFINEQGVTRYPSQLYEAFLEGWVLFVILWLFSQKPRAPMVISALFLILYGMFRFIVEFVRMPDVQLGYLAFGWLTMGQLLSLPMVVLGAFLLLKAKRV
ncbi:Prolipoprotein diacylglyceryl transferase [Bathymodiolus thermophilus thioautotrophic gill symbiont]|uniref:Phosphatidylglycerol--prolipoprotein diacylglyceryl transferase n=1 Tax=Bathymodiolus thermophilus thioautotrophic gill symbiont TaxID=2360 RepID=A0A1J5TS64_9GAMM|nr:prolipoprotein diacylglyceryl transferase [Bathymodiolus thermophilus thioautotrophic gill symbiont]AYQ56651.1 Prolipoprotein diacylglyceryl transferase [Bathymodiolus thermophilus thioautotrophic gill symbiont]OIR23754.1 prolipoprotein diacylglyceryl transferase [Bathymodiolus thermophilus thioautotrophic gill symbiont]CAB5498040.1 Prolipoprotein diacylglyceryl transferase [Bathymodiolus thermophilus thioautotrophic gill symbiont]CAB5503211.1 Prolipoprotein diacylglyceryl transferase [Bathy